MRILDGGMGQRFALAHDIFAHMKTSAPALVPFLRSDAQARLLAELLLGPEGEASLSDLAVVMGVNPSSAHREIGRLTEAGMLRERRVGRTRLISVNRDYRFLEPLAQILATAYGRCKRSAASWLRCQASRPC